MKVRNARLVLGLAILIAAGQVCASHVVAPAGYTAGDTVFPIPSEWTVYGFDRLPNGNFVVFIDDSIVQVTPSGVVSTPLYSFGSSIYGSFLKVLGNSIYFGESSNGTIWHMGLDGSSPTLMGAIGNNYDLAFNSLGQAFVSANPGWAGQKLFYFDGTADEVVTDLAGYSGPLAFDASDNLLYGTAYASGGDSLLRFSSTAVAGAIGSGYLTQASGEVLADIAPPSDMEIDSLGNVFFTNNETLYRLQSESSSATSFATSEWWLTSLRYYASDGSFSVLVNGDTDENGNPLGVISTLRPVPEPNALLSLATLISCTGAALLKRRQRRSAQMT